MNYKHKRAVVNIINTWMTMTVILLTHLQLKAEQMDIKNAYTRISKKLQIATS